MTRDQLAAMLENEAANAAAELIRGGEDPLDVLPAVLRTPPRYDDAHSYRCRATFRGILSGTIQLRETT